MADPRIYVATIGGEDMLIRAKSRTDALRHAVRLHVHVELASQDTLVELVSQGIPVQNAADDAEGGAL